MHHHFTYIHIYFCHYKSICSTEKSSLLRQQKCTTSLVRAIQPATLETKKCYVLDWYPGEPNNVNHGENCACFWDPFPNMQWNDFNCSIPGYFICEQRCTFIFVIIIVILCFARTILAWGILT